MSDKQPRLTLQGLKVLKAFAENPREPLSGADVRRLTGLATGTLYPILLRFEQARWLQSEWEDVDPKEAGRPRRRLYNITPMGQHRVQEEFHGLMPEGDMAWST